VLGVVCVRGWLLVFLSFLVQMPGTSPRWPMELCLLSCLQLRCCIPCYGAFSRAMSCTVTAAESVFRRADSRFKAMICSSEQCLPNLSLRALPVIICVLFASKRSVGVEAPSATRGLAMTCTRFSWLYTIRLDETRAEIHFRSAENCLLFSLLTHILES